MNCEACKNGCCCEYNPDSENHLDIVASSNCCKVHNQNPIQCQYIVQFTEKDNAARLEFFLDLPKRLKAKSN